MSIARPSRDLGTVLLDQITPVILTHNEEVNLGRSLGRLKWARSIVVVDSLSSDSTLQIAANHPGVRVFSRAFDTHASQWSFATEATGIRTEWILALDADYIVAEDFIDELKRLKPAPDISAYWVSFRYCILGRPLRGSLYPPVLALFRRGKGRYVQDGHTQRLQVFGRSGTLDAKILHDDRKPLRRWLASQRRYAQLEAGHLLSTSSRPLDSVGRIKLMAWPAPMLVFIYVMFVRGCVLDGWPGWLYALQRGVAETMIAAAVLRRRLDRFHRRRSLTSATSASERDK